MDDYESRTTGYDLFVKIAKNLALKLPHAKDRVLASKWIRKIDNLMDLDYPQKSKYLKLISISMQSKVLVGPFKFPPSSDDFDIQELVNLKPSNVKDMVADEHKFILFRPNPYHSAISDDLKEYVVVQEIPEFGTHFYYAYSVDPITEWRNNNFTIMPHGSLESSVIIPPLSTISASKEEFVENYNLYIESFKNECDNPCEEPPADEDMCEPASEELDSCFAEPEEPPENVCPTPKRHSKCKRK